MTRLLYIKASPRGDASTSAKIADTYLSVLREHSQGLIVDTLDLSMEMLPEFDGDKVAAKVAVLTGSTPNANGRTAWNEITEIAQRFISADRYLLAVPMWNGGLPYRLKHYIDVIHQPGLLWGLDPKVGYFGLLKNKRAVLSLTSGAFDPEITTTAFGVDHHASYLRFWLEQAGVDAIDELRFQPTLLSSDPNAGLERAIEAARALAIQHARERHHG